ncbi:MAG: type III pantothenate kinase [Bacteroidia bacterium]|nr:type III pantothenate kinase [Bacteroidia bacterium]
MILPIETRIYLAVDIGNTRTKVAYFDSRESILSNSKPQQFWFFFTDTLEESLAETLSHFAPSSVLSVGYISTSRVINPEEMQCWNRFEEPPVFHRIHSLTPFPLNNRYTTPHTLGTDRIVAITGALTQVHNTPVLVVDAGTAITYDFATSRSEYLGGGISAGIRMRFRALHEFTARLPLIEEARHTPLIGDSTLNSMMSGVINGTIAEIGGIIRQYRQKFGEEVRVFLTGGDAVFISEKLPEEHVMDECLVLKGIAVLLL